MGFNPPTLSEIYPLINNKISRTVVIADTSSKTLIVYALLCENIVASATVSIREWKVRTIKPNSDLGCFLLTCRIGDIYTSNCKVVSINGSSIKTQVKSPVVSVRSEEKRVDTDIYIDYSNMYVDTPYLPQPNQWVDYFESQIEFHLSSESSHLFPRQIFQNLESAIEITLNNLKFASNETSNYAAQGGVIGLLGGSLFGPLGAIAGVALGSHLGSNKIDPSEAEILKNRLSRLYILKQIILNKYNR